MLHQAAMLIIFFAAAVPKDSQRFSEWCASTFYFYAVSFQSVNSKACGSMAASLYFIFRKVGLLRFKAATIITAQTTLWLTKKNYGLQTQLVLTVSKFTAAINKFFLLMNVEQPL
jgi:hypothetical protein